MKLLCVLIVVLMLTGCKPVSIRPTRVTPVPRTTKFIKPSVSPEVDPTPTQTKAPTSAPTPAPSIDLSILYAPGFIALISYFETALEDITGLGVSVSTNEADWEVTQTGLRYVLKSTVKIDKITHDVIMKIEFDDDLYEWYEVYQLKIDGYNIDL